MYIKNEEDIIINNAIMHILNNKENIKILSDMVMHLSDKTIRLLRRHILNSLNSDNVRLAKFEGDVNVVQSHCQKLIDNEECFITSSIEIANYLYDAMSGKNIKPAYLVVCKMTHQNNHNIALLKLDFNENLTSKIIEIDGKKRVDIVAHGTGIPNSKQKLQKCVFYKKYEADSEYDIILLDRQASKYKDEAEVADYFAKKFLHCRLAITDRENTRNFSTYAALFIDDNFKDDLEKNNELKEKVISILKADEKINLASFADTTFGDNEEMKERFIEFMRRKTIDMEFDIDQNWVLERIKRRKITTDVGIIIFLNETESEEKSKNENFDITYPYKDKSRANILIKNVRYTDKYIK